MERNWSSSVRMWKLLTDTMAFPGLKFDVDRSFSGPGIPMSWPSSWALSEGVPIERGFAFLGSPSWYWGHAQGSTVYWLPSRPFFARGCAREPLSPRLIWWIWRGLGRLLRSWSGYLTYPMIDYCRRITKTSAHSHFYWSDAYTFK